MTTITNKSNNKQTNNHNTGRVSQCWLWVDAGTRSRLDLRARVIADLERATSHHEKVGVWVGVWVCGWAGGPVGRWIY